MQARRLVLNNPQPVFWRLPRTLMAVVGGGWHPAPFAAQCLVELRADAVRPPA